MASRKRAREVTNFDEVTEPMESATIHGVITSLSPIKKGRKSVFFDGHASDEKSSKRIVAFSPSQHSEMEKYKSGRKVVKFDDCQVARGRRGDQLEFVMKSKSTLGPSSHQIDTSAIDTNVLVTGITSKCVYDLVNVHAKVLKISGQETLDDGSIKQDIIVGDLTGTLRVTVWGEIVGTLSKGDSYLFSNFMVREFSGLKYLSMRKDLSVIEQIRDIGETVESSDSDLSGGEVLNAQVVGVSEFVRKKICYRCKGHVEPGSEVEGPKSGQCCLCGMIQRYDLCKSRLVAKLAFIV